MTSMFQFGSRTRVESESSAQERYKASATNGSSAVAASPRDLGAALRERREAMGISLAEAEAATRIRQKYIAALEADEWHLLPGEVVGRGFLRNYSVFLGLEPYDVLNRRRTAADPSLATVLSTTSAGSDLPPVRQVDYRPKDVDLREENEVMETRELRLAPIFSVLGVLAFLAVLWFGRDAIANGMTALSANIQDLMARAAAPAVAPAEPTVDSAADVAGIVNPENTGATANPAASAPPTGTDAAAGVPSDAAAGDSDASAGTPADSASEEDGPADDNGLGLILVPTATPTPGEAVTEPEPADTGEQATDEAAAQAAEELPPLPTPTPLPAAAEEPQAAAAEAVVEEPVAPAPEEVEAEEEPPEEVVVVPAACADLRAAITSPGVGQPVAGVVPVIGTADHEAFQYYKLEYAPGADAAGGYVYFDGGNQAVVGGQLGSLNTTALPNGPFTLQIVVVDQTGNFPPPCRVTIEVQN